MIKTLQSSLQLWLIMDQEFNVSLYNTFIQWWLHIKSATKKKPCVHFILKCYKSFILFYFLYFNVLGSAGQAAAPWQIYILKYAAVFTHLCDLFLESERESGASVGEGPCSVGHVLQPLNDQGGWNVEWEIPYDVKVWRICGATHAHLNPTDLLHMTTFHSVRFSPSSHGLEMFTGNPRSIL